MGGYPGGMAGMAGRAAAGDPYAQGAMANEAAMGNPAAHQAMAGQAAGGNGGATGALAAQAGRGDPFAAAALQGQAAGGNEAAQGAMAADSLMGGPISQMRNAQRANEAGNAAQQTPVRANAQRAMRPMSAMTDDASRKAIAQQEAMNRLQQNRNPYMNNAAAGDMNAAGMSDAANAAIAAEEEADALLEDVPPGAMKAAMKAAQMAKKVGPAAAAEAESLAAADPNVSPAQAKAAGAQAAADAERALEDYAAQEQEIDRQGSEREAARQAGDMAEEMMARMNPQSRPSERAAAGAQAAAQVQQAFDKQRNAEGHMENMAERNAQRKAANEAAGEAAAGDAAMGGATPEQAEAAGQQAAAASDALNAPGRPEREMQAAELGAAAASQMNPYITPREMRAAGIQAAQQERSRPGSSPGSLMRAGMEGAMQQAQADGTRPYMSPREMRQAAAEEGAAEGVEIARRIKQRPLQRAAAEGAAQGVAMARKMKQPARAMREAAEEEAAEQLAAEQAMADPRLSDIAAAEEGAAEGRLLGEAMKHPDLVKALAEGEAEGHALARKLGPPTKAEAAAEGAAEGEALGKALKRDPKLNAAAAAAEGEMEGRKMAQSMKRPGELAQAAAEGAAEGIKMANAIKVPAQMARAAEEGALEGQQEAQRIKEAEMEAARKAFENDPQIQRAINDGAAQGIAAAKAAKQAAATGRNPMEAAEEAAAKEDALQQVARDPVAQAAIAQDLAEEEEEIEKLAETVPEAAMKKALLQGASPEEAFKKGESVAAKNVINNAKETIAKSKPYLQPSEAIQEAQESAEAARAEGFIPKDEAAARVEQAAMDAEKRAAMKAAEPSTDSPAGLGIIATVPDDAEAVRVKNSSMHLPMKSFTDVEAKSEREAEALARQNDLKEGLRNKVTKNPIDSPLNMIMGEDGYYNVPESAKELEITKGRAIFPESAKESMKNAGLDTSTLQHKINTGERKDMGIGLGYYVADVSGMHMDVPSPSNPTPSKALVGEKGALDTSLATGLDIESGVVKMTPWSEYSKRVRPRLNQGISKRPRMSAADEKMLKKALETRDLLQNTKTEVLTNPNGEDYVKVTPPYGVPEQVAVADAIANLNGKPKSKKSSGQDGVSLLQGTDSIGFNLEDALEGSGSMNIAEKPDLTGSVEDQVIGKSLNNAAMSGTAKDTMTPVNAFTGLVDLEKKSIVAPEEERPKPSKDQSKNDMVMNELKYDTPTKAKKLNVGESSYISAVNKLPPDLILFLIDYAINPHDSSLKALHEKYLSMLASLLPNKSEAFEGLIYEAIKKQIGLANPKNLYTAPIKEVTKVVYNKERPNEPPKLQKIFVDKSPTHKVEPMYVPKKEMIKKVNGKVPDLKIKEETKKEHPKVVQITGVRKVDANKVPRERMANAKTVEVVNKQKAQGNVPKQSSTTNVQQVPASPPKTTTSVIRTGPANNQAPVSNVPSGPPTGTTPAHGSAPPMTRYESIPRGYRIVRQVPVNPAYVQKVVNGKPGPTVVAVSPANNNAAGHK
ncbi:putative polar tube protein 3 (PTP3) [Trachipleistophora hominis]|uniref:Putative polar tube protein 3 (PTP3) n=1 Tax=Trachipleistophora hominis TaxID=72359 RepID=L7JVW8_TRAHO|nr:putative polar tube protein 3 (PTP3) [Trachipleistophora hominis]